MAMILMEGFDLDVVQTNPVGRKRHCGYLKVDDDGNIATDYSSELFFNSSNQKKQCSVRNSVRPLLRTPTAHRDVFMPPAA